MEVAVEEILKRRTDSRGRVTLSSEYARCEVELVVIDSEPVDE